MSETLSAFDTIWDQMTADGIHRIAGYMPSEPPFNGAPLYEVCKKSERAKLREPKQLELI